jgi:RNA polymerase sigma-70 factor (family 1)
MTDQELLTRLEQGDQRAFTQLYERHWPGMYRSAYAVLRDEAACLDVLQDIFSWLWAHRDKLVIGNLKYYLLSAVKYKVANVIRSGKVRASLFTDIEACRPSDLMYDEDPTELKELKAAIAAFTAGLPDRAGQVFHLSRNEQLSNKEIAARLGISEKTVENQMTTNLKKLRASLGKLSAWYLFFI